MRRRLLTCLAKLLLTMSPVAHAASLPTQMTASGGWKVDYGYTECTAQHDYLDEDGKATLSIRPSPLGDVVELVIGRDGRGPDQVQQSRAEVSVGAKSAKGMMLRYGLNRPSSRNFDIYSVPIIFLDALRSDVVLSFRPKESRAYDLPALGMGKVVDALTTCVADLRRFWNMDVDSRSRIAKPATSELRTIFTSDDFPAEAYWNGQEGTGQFLVMVDEAGKIVGCSPTRTSGIPVFDIMSCGVIKERAKATPALDRDGKGIRSTILSPPITFRIGG